MPYGVGITSDQAERRCYWQRQHPTPRKLREVVTNRNQSQAQQLENRKAASRGCPASRCRAVPVRA